MKAILFGWDKDVGLMELTYKCYMKLWPGCPLEFRVPINDIKNPDFEYFKTRRNVSLHHCDSHMRDTFIALLDGIEDEEWIYWCISDRYPVALHPDIHKLYKSINEVPNDVSTIKLFYYLRSDRPCNQKFKIEGLDFYEIKAKNPEWGFWLHQFVKCKWFKNIVLHKSIKDYKKPSQDKPIKIKRKLNEIMSNDKSVAPHEDDNLLILGEPSMRKNRLTKNGCEDLNTMKCKLTGRKVSSKSVYWPETKKIKPGYKAIRDL